MFNLGFSEMILLFVIALMVIGPKQLPGMAKTIGRFVGEMRKVVSDLGNEVNQASKNTSSTMDEIKQEFNQIDSVDKKNDKPSS